MKKILTWFLKPFKKIQRRWLIAKAYPKMKEAYQKQLTEQKLVKGKIKVWLKDYFGINANSKYIPKEYKSKEEVKVAIIDKFGSELERVNLKYTDLFA